MECYLTGMDFWTVFAAVLCAGLLLVMFVWACVNVSRREQRQESLSLYLGAMLMPLGFALLSFMIATDSVPAWLEAISR